MELLSKTIEEQKKIIRDQAKQIELLQKRVYLLEEDVLQGYLNVLDGNHTTCETCQSELNRIKKDILPLWYQDWNKHLKGEENEQRTSSNS